MGLSSLRGGMECPLCGREQEGFLETDYCPVCDVQVPV